MTAALQLLPPVIYQATQPTPLTPLSAAAFGLLAIAAFVAALRKPQWAAALLAFVIPFAFYRDIWGTTLTLEKVAVVGIAAGLVARGAPLVPASIAARRILVAGLVVLGAIIISGVNATYMAPVVREVLKQAEYLVMFWCAASLIIEQRDDTRWLEGGVIAAMLIVAGDALAQALIGGAPSAVLVNGQSLPRVAGPLEGPNQLAGYLEIGLPLAVLSPLLLTGRLKLLRAVTIAAVMAALVLSQSRMGIAVATFGYLIVWLIDRSAARQALVPFIAGACAGLAIACTWYWGATHNLAETFAYLFRLVLPQNPGSVGTRNELWRAAIAMFSQHPFTGVGAGNYELLLGQYGLPDVRTHANSLWLQTLAEQGVVGFVALVGLLAVLFREMFVGLRRSWLMQVAFVATVSLLLHLIVEYLVFFPKVGLMWWLLLGAAAGTAAFAPAPEARRATPASAPEGVTVVPASRQPPAPAS